MKERTIDLWNAFKADERAASKTKLDHLKARLTRQLADEGWTNEHTYNRDWKKEVAETKRLIQAAEKESIR
jgi:hypothetical protein